MSSIQDLDGGISNLESAISSLGAHLQSALDDLKAKLDAAGNPVDVTNELSRITAATNVLSGFDAQAVAADPGAASVSSSASGQANTGTSADQAPAPTS